MPRQLITVFYLGAQVAENLLPQSQCETFVELIEDIVKQLRLDPTRALPLVAHGPPDQSAGGSPVTSRRPRDRDHSLDTAKVTVSFLPVTVCLLILRICWNL